VRAAAFFTSAGGAGNENRDGQQIGDAPAFRVERTASLDLVLEAAPCGLQDA
jgi:hypothetical protein